MARTYQNLIDEAREILQDTDEDAYRWSETHLLNTLNRGLQELGRIRPDAYYDTFTTDDIVVPEVTDATLGDTFPIPMMFYAALVMYIAGMAELIEDEFATDGRAITLITQFKQQVISL